MLDHIQKRAEDVQAQEIEIREHCEAGDAARTAAAMYREFHEDVMREVDALFGADEIVPGIELFDDFFSQLLPFFEAYSRERAEKLGRYSAARTANV